jgi:hypothetical protein
MRIFSILPFIATAIIIATERTDVFNSRSSSFVALVISMYSVIYYYLKLLKPDVEKIMRSPAFWFITGLFTYYTGTFFIVTTFKLFVEYDRFGIQAQLWLMHNVILFLMCVSFSIGFSCRKYPTI